MSRRIKVRSTINLAGMRVGREARVDPDDPYIAQLIAARFLEPLNPRDRTDKDAARDEKAAAKAEESASEPDPVANETPAVEAEADAQVALAVEEAPVDEAAAVVPSVT